MTRKEGKHTSGHGRHNKDSDQPAHPYSLINNLRCPHEETLHPWLSEMRPVKILIRLRECAV